LKLSAVREFAPLFLGTGFFWIIRIHAPPEEVKHTSNNFWIAKGI